MKVYRRGQDWNPGKPEFFHAFFLQLDIGYVFNYDDLLCIYFSIQSFKYMKVTYLSFQNNKDNVALFQRATRIHLKRLSQ